MDLTAALARAARRRKGIGGPLERKEYLPGGVVLPPGRAGTPVGHGDWSLRKAVQSGLKRDPLVHSAVRTIAQSAASVPWIAEEKRGDDWQEAPDHELQGILDTPNEDATGGELVERQTFDLVLAGNVLEHKITVGRKLPGAKFDLVKERRRLSPDEIHPVPGTDGRVARYETRRGLLRSRTWEPFEVTHVQLPDPENEFWGLSLLESLARVVDTHRLGIDWNLSAVQNRAVSDVAFVSDQPMDVDEWEDYREMIHEAHGGADSAREPWVFGGGFKLHQLSRSPVEMDFAKTLVLYRETILGSLDVPPVMAGFFEKATLANANASRRLFWLDKMLPFLTRIQWAYRRGLVPHFGDPAKLRCRFDVSQVEALREDKEAQARVLFRLVKTGVPYNEAITVAGLQLQPIPDLGDVPFGLEPGQVEEVAGKLLDWRSPRSVALEIPAPLARQQLAKLSSGWPLRSGESKAGRLLTFRRRPREFKLQAVAAVAPIQDVGRRAEREISGAWLDWTESVRKAADLQRIVDALKATRGDALLEALGLDRLEEERSGLAGLLQSTAAAGAAVAIDDLAGQVGVEAEEDDEAIAGWLAGKATLPATLTASDRAGLQRAAQAWADGRLGDVGPDQIGDSATVAAGLFLSLIGLNGPQVDQVVKFSSGLISSGAEVPVAIAKGQRQAKGFLRARAALVAGQEGTLAAHFGQDSVWNKAVRGGLVSSKTTKTWVDADDADVCPICLDLDGQTVLTTERFLSLVTGDTYGGPGEPHTRCRCGLIYLAVAIALAA